MEIEAVDPLTAPDDDLAGVHALETAFHHELLPEDPLDPLDRFMARCRTPWPYEEVRWWVARERSRVTGFAALWLSRITPENRHLAWCTAAVAPDRRREGIGAQLLGPVLDAAEADERTVIGFGTGRDHQAAAWCRRLAGAPRYTERMSRLHLHRVDRALLEEWVRRAKERADGYELGGFEGACPAEHLEEFARARNVMNSAPREELDMDDEEVTPEQVAERQRWFAAVGITPRVLWARHADSGEIAGYTALLHDRWTPWKVDQGDTGVWHQHRERGLGRWLKAAMLLRVLDERPEARWIDTENAGTNRAMLAINDALGFGPVLWVDEFQAPIDQVRAAL